MEVTKEEKIALIKEFELDEFESGKFSKAINYGSRLYYSARQPVKHDNKISEKKLNNAYNQIIKYRDKPFLPKIVAFDTETAEVNGKQDIILGQFTFNKNVLNYMRNEPMLYRFILSQLDENDTILLYSRKDTLKVLKSLPDNTLVPVHNLKYDYSYLIRALLLDIDVSIEELRNDMALFTSKLTIDGREILMYDTAKQYPTSLRKIGEMIGVNKLETYYPAYFKDDKHILLSKEYKEYARMDTIVLLKAVENSFLYEYLKPQGVFPTSGGLAYYKLKSEFKNHDFYEYFPPYSTRKSENDVKLEYRTYKGGLVYVNPKIKNKLQKDIDIYDATSMYPDKMRNRKMAYGQPTYKYMNWNKVLERVQKLDTVEKQEKEEIAHFYFLTIRGTFSKENIILLNHYEKRQYAKAFGIEGVTTAHHFPDWFEICFPDNELVEILKFMKDTNVQVKGMVRVIETKKKIFPEIQTYMDKGFDRKLKYSSKDNYNESMRSYAKLLINSPYGKFGTRRELTAFKAELDENDNVQIVETETNEGGEYVLFASYITGMARAQILSMIAVSDVYYTDTDSIHLPHSEAEQLKKRIPDLFDDVELGKFKHENYAIEGIYSQPKTYIEKIFNKKKNKIEYDVHCAGLNNLNHLTTENFLNERIEVVLKSRSTSYGIILKNQLVYVNYTVDKTSYTFKQQNKKVRRLQKKVDEFVRNTWLEASTLEKQEKADKKINKYFDKIRSKQV